MRIFFLSLLLHNVNIKLDLEATSLSSHYKRILSFLCLVVTLLTVCFNWSLICYLQEEDEVEWKELKAEVFATVMDFFATGIPVISEEKAPSDTGTKRTCILQQESLGFPPQTQVQNYQFWVATAQEKQAIWFLFFPDRENTGNFAVTQGKFLDTGKIFGLLLLIQELCFYLF